MSSIPTKQIDGDAAVGRNVAIGGDVTIQGSETIGHNLKVKGWLEAPNIKGVNKGLFSTAEQLRMTYPNPRCGWWALVAEHTSTAADKDSYLGQVYMGMEGGWVAMTNADGTPKLGGNPSVDYAEQKEIVDSMRSTLETLYRNLDNFYTKGIEFAGNATELKVICHQHDPNDNAREDYEVDFPMATSAGAGAMSAAQAQLLDRMAQRGTSSMSLAAGDGRVDLEYKTYSPITDREVTLKVAAPMATTTQSGFMSVRQAKALEGLGTAASAFLSVGPGGVLVAHGVGAYLEQGLTPVVFRHLRRGNKLTEDGARGPVERRWTRFTKLSDAVAIDADTGAVNFRTDLLSPSPDITEDGDVASRTNDASALITSPEGSIVYGRSFFSLNDPAGWRMLVFDFILGFVDLTDETPGRRWTLADTPVQLPFRVRFTPTYEREDEAMVAAHAHFNFGLRT